MLVVAGLSGTFLGLDISTPANEGANIGAGLVGLPLLFLGLPWTLPSLFIPYTVDPSSPPLFYLLLVGPAWLNVALVAAWRVRQIRESAPIQQR